MAQIMPDLMRIAKMWPLAGALAIVLFIISHIGVGGAVRFLVAGTIGKEVRPARDQLWMEQYLISLKYWPN